MTTESTTENGEESTAEDTVTVLVWQGGPRASYDDLLDEEPDEYELEVRPAGRYVPHEGHVVLADEIEHHGTYAFDIDTDRPVELHVETSDHYHDTISGFEQGSSIERGLPYWPDDDYEPFKTEIWGAIRMRVEAIDDD